MTTFEAHEAIGLAHSFLVNLGFRPASAAAGSLEVVRGRVRPVSRKVVQLPQVVRLEYDRGRITVAASIVPKGRKEKPIHARLMTALVRALERLLADRLPAEQAAAEWVRVDSTAGTIWTAIDVIGVVCLILLGLLLAILLLAVLCAAFAK